jgi:uncharacterized protein YndB with AHSA1/START domain
MKDEAVIPVPPEVLWPYIADPVQMARWNDKIVSIDRRRSGPVVYGERYDVRLQMSGKERLFRVEVTNVFSSEQVAFRYDVDGHTGKYVLEIYQLKPDATGTRLTQKIDLSHALPAPVWLLANFIHKFGWAAEEPLLERLKRTIAQDLAGGSPELSGSRRAP